MQENYDIAHKDVKMFCDINQFPFLVFCVPHQKLHGVRGFVNHYHM